MAPPAVLASLCMAPPSGKVSIALDQLWHSGCQTPDICSLGTACCSWEITSPPAAFGQSHTGGGPSPIHYPLLRWMSEPQCCRDSRRESCNCVIGIWPGLSSEDLLGRQNGHWAVSLHCPGTQHLRKRCQLYHCPARSQFVLSERDPAEQNPVIRSPVSSISPV